MLFSVLAAATGQVMLKHGMQIATALAHDSGGSLVIHAITTPWVLLGLVVFEISAVAWLATLARVGYLVTLTASISLLHERATLLTWAGSLLVVSGLIIVVLSKP